MHIRLSDSDILTAWTVKITLSSISRELPNKNSQTAAIMTVVDMRKRCPSVFPSPDHINKGRIPVYIQNLNSVAMTHLPIKAIIEQPLGITASQIRRSITPQLSKSVISDLTRHVLAAPGRTALFAKGSEILVPVSNWTCAKLFDFDLSSAITLSCTDIGSKALPARPVAIAPVGFSKNPEIRNAWGVTGRDAEGNYWLQATCSDATWAMMEKELARLEAAWT